MAVSAASARSRLSRRFPDAACRFPIDGHPLERGLARLFHHPRAKRLKALEVVRKGKRFLPRACPRPIVAHNHRLVVRTPGQVNPTRVAYLFITLPSIHTHYCSRTH